MVRVQESEREDAAERVSEEPSGWVSGASGRGGGGGARHSAGQRAGRRVTDGRALTSVLQPLAELPALPDPQLLLLLLPGGTRRVGPGGLHDGGVRSGVQGGSGRLHFLRGGGKRPAAVAGKRGASGASSPGASPGRGGDSGSEHQGDEDGRRTNSGCSAPAAARGRLITARGGEGQVERGAASRRCPSPPRPAELRRRRERLREREPPQPALAMARSASSSSSSLSRA